MVARTWGATSDAAVSIAPWLLALVLLAGPVLAQNLTIDGAVRYQTMDGMGTNINVWSWKGGELQPALDLLIDVNGASVFRVVRDPMTWAAQNQIAGLHALDAATLTAVYEQPAMQDIWGVIGYLNQKGIGGDQIVLNFMGWTPTWMGGSGQYNVASHINAGNNMDIATMIASCVYYGRVVKGLDFTMVSPFNETDTAGLEGPQLGTPQYTTIAADMIGELDAMGQPAVRLVGPDTAGGGEYYIQDLMGNSAIKARMDHLSFHAYNISPSPGASYPPLNYWLAETAQWCDGCDQNGTPPQGEWAFARGTADLLLGDVSNGFAAILTWEGYDSFYYHHDSWSTWGQLDCHQGASPCSTGTDASGTRLYAMRKRGYVSGILNRGIRPGMSSIGVTESISNLTALSFYNPTTGELSIVGHNTGGSTANISGRLSNLPAMSALQFFQTDSGSNNIAQQADVTVSSQTFSASVPADTFFLLQTTALAAATATPTVASAATATPTATPSVTPALTFTITAPALTPTATTVPAATPTATDAAPVTPTATTAPAATPTAPAALTVTRTRTATATPTATASATGGASTIWRPTATPANAADPDGSAVELGVKFTSDVNGLITGIRFYKGATNTGTHTGSLWSSGGQRLATATFSGETATGWQQVNFTSPVAITATTVYVASYHTNVGHYASNTNYFAAAGVDNPPLHALRNGVSGGNGVYAYGSGAFPTNTYQSSNYWVDVVFNPAPTATPSMTRTATPSRTGTATATTTRTATATTTRTVTPTAPASATVTPTAFASATVTPTAPASATVTPTAPAAPTVTPTAPAAPTVTPMNGFIVDVSVSVDGTGTVTTSTFQTALPGELVLAFVASDGPASGTQTATVSGAGLTWTLVGRANSRAGTSEIWQASAATPVTGTVTATQANKGYDQSLTVVAIQGSSGVGASSAAGAASGAPSVSLTTASAGSLVFGVGNDWDHAIGRTLGANQIFQHQWVDTRVGDTFWVQNITAPTGPTGSVATLNDTAPTSDRWNFAAVEVTSAASP